MQAPTTSTTTTSHQTIPSTTIAPLFNSLPVGNGHSANTNNTINYIQNSQLMNGVANQLASNLSVSDAFTNGHSNSSPQLNNGMSRNKFTSQPKSAKTNFSVLGNSVVNTSQFQPSFSENVPPLDYSTTTPNSLSYEELLDLYLSTRTNFLEARNQLEENGKSSPGVYRELDGIQKQLNYKSDHYRFLLLNTSRSDLNILQKLREKASQKSYLLPQDESRPNLGAAKRPSNGSVNSSGKTSLAGNQQQQQQTPVYQVNSIRVVDTGAKNSFVSQPQQTSSNGKPTDIELYLQKVAQLRGEDVAKAEAARLQERNQPLKRVAIGPDTEMNFNSILNEINSKSLSKAAAVDFFKKNIPPLSEVEDYKKVAEILMNLLQGYMRELTGSQFDYRSIIVNEILTSFKEDHEALKIISKNTRALLRITNWLRRDLKNQDQESIKADFGLLERLKLSTTQMENLDLSRIMNFVKKKEPKWREVAEKIMKLGEEVQKISPPPASSKEVTSAITSSSTPQQPAKNNLVNNFSRRPQQQVRDSSQSSEAPISSKTDPIKPSTTQPTSTQSRLQQDYASVKASQNSNEAKKKWSFNNYIQSSKRKASGSEASSLNKEVSQESPISTEQDKSSSPGSLRSILKTKSSTGASKLKKSVRFSSQIETREFESEVHIGPIDQEHKRAREMESSEAQTLKKHKSLEDPEAAAKKPSHKKVIVHDHMEWYTPKPIDFKSIQGLPDDCTVLRGGFVPLQLFTDLNVPKEKPPVTSVETSSPFEPNGLIVDAQEAIDSSKNEAVSTGPAGDFNVYNAGFAEEEEDDDYVLPDIEESKEEPHVVEEEVIKENPSPVVEKTKHSGTNKNVDEDVLALLDDDDVLNSHNDGDEDDYSETNIQNENKIQETESSKADEDQVAYQQDATGESHSVGNDEMVQVSQANETVSQSQGEPIDNSHSSNANEAVSDNQTDLNNKLATGLSDDGDNNSIEVVVLSSDESSSKESDEEADPKIDDVVEHFDASGAIQQETNKNDSPLDAKEFTNLIKEQILRSNTPPPNFNQVSGDSSFHQKDSGRIHHFRPLPTSPKHKELPPRSPQQTTNSARFLTIKGASRRSPPLQQTWGDSYSPQKRSSSHFDNNGSPNKLSTSQHLQRTSGVSNIFDINENSHPVSNYKSTFDSFGNELFPSKVGQDGERSDELFPGQRQRSDHLPKGPLESYSHKRPYNGDPHHVVGGRPVERRAKSSYVAPDQFADLRRRDVRQYVRDLPDSVTNKHTIVCKYFPNCHIGQKCHFIHLNEMAPRHERFESYQPRR